MTAPKKYIKLMEDILKAAAAEGEKRPVFEWKSVTAAKKHEKVINGLLEELRKLRLQIHDEIDKLRADFSEKKTAASRGTNLSGRGGFMMKKGTMSNMRLEDIRRQELASLFPYESAQRRIDEEITQLDRTKTEIERWLENASESSRESGVSNTAKEDKHG
jgi:DNA-binding transcriptional regulator GbsR (MarR family)